MPARAEERRAPRPRSTSSSSMRVRRLVVGVVAPDGRGLQDATRAGREPLEARRDDVRERLRDGARLLAEEAQELLGVERHDRARPAERRRARPRRAREGLERPRPWAAERARAPPRRPRASRGRSSGELVADEQRGHERRVAQRVGERVAARAVDRAEVVDGQDDPVAAGPLARAHDRPAKRLGRGEPAVLG